MSEWTELEGYVGDGSFLTKDPLSLMEHHNNACKAYKQCIADLESRIVWTVSSLEDMIKYCDSRKLQEEYANVIAIAKGRKQ